MMISSFWPFVENYRTQITFLGKELRFIKTSGGGIAGIRV